MNRVISKALLPTVSRAVNTRNIFTKEYLGLAFTEGKEKEAHAKAGRNVTKIKDNLMKSYKQRGIKDLKRYDIMNYMHLVEGEKDMANLSIVVKDFLAHVGDPKHKRDLLCKSIQTSYLKGDVKYSRLLSE